MACPDLTLGSERAIPVDDMFDKWRTESRSKFEPKAVAASSLLTQSLKSLLASRRSEQRHFCLRETGAGSWSFSLCLPR
jgi:hypothetical protein